MAWVFLATAGAGGCCWASTTGCCWATVGPTCQLKQNKKIKRSNPLPLGFLDRLIFQYGERLGCWPGHNENIKKKMRWYLEFGLGPGCQLGTF